MGVLNVAPDVFANGGGHPDRAALVARGRRLIAEGADIVEVSGISHRRGATPLDRATETERVVAVVEALAGDVRVSVDTRSTAVAVAAVAAGATLVNDVSVAPAPGREALYAVAADAGVGWVAVHDPRRDASADVVAEVSEALGDRVEQAAGAGVEEIYVDPGIGLGPRSGGDLELLGNLERLGALGRPMVVGTGHGRFIDELHAAADSAAAEPVSAGPEGSGHRLEGSLAVAVWAMLAGASVVRTHHVAATVEAARTVGTKPPVGSIPESPS